MPSRVFVPVDVGEDQEIFVDKRTFEPMMVDEVSAHTNLKCAHLKMHQRLTKITDSTC